MLRDWIPPRLGATGGAKPRGAAVSPAADDAAAARRSSGALEPAPAPAPAPAEAADRWSADADIAAHLDLQPAAFSRWGVFADPAVEAAYVRRELRGRFARAVPRVMVVFVVLTALILVQEVAANGTILRFSSLTTLSLCLVTAALGAGVPLALRRGAPMGAVSGAFTLGMAAMGGAVQFSHPYRAALLSGDAPFLAASAAAGLSWSQASLYLRALAILTTVGLFTPIQTAHFAAVGVATVAATVAAQLAAPLPPGGDATRDTLISFLLLLLIFAAHARLVRAERTRYHFHRAVYAAVVERQSLERQEHEQRLRASQAEAATQARARLIRVVMHDLRSPLLSVASMSEMLAARPLGTKLGAPPVRRAVESIGSCARLMENIVSDMLDFERIDSGRLELVHALFSARQLLASSLATFAPLAAKKGVALESTPLPAAMRRARYVGDVLRLTQCLNNGVSNAIKFTSAGGRVVLRAAERPHPDESGWVFLDVTVEDSGAGLSPSELETLRTQGPFAQVGAGQLQGNGGTGLGLNIVRSVLALHNGSHLELASEGAGKGTRFVLHIACPRARAPSHRRASGGAISAASAAERVTSGSEHSTTDDGGSHKNGRASGVERSAGRRSGAHSASNAEPSAAHAAAGPSSADRAEVAAAALAAAGSGHQRFAPYGGGGNDDIDEEAAPAGAEAGEGGGADAEGAEGGGPAAVLRCLHVEDDLMLRFTLGARIFEPRAAHCDSAEDGRQALELVRQRPGEYALILMDNQMPNMGGSEATRALRQLGYRGVIIGMTGDPSGSADRREFEEAGLDVCVDKTTQGLEYVASVLDDMIRAAHERAQLGARWGSKRANKAEADGPEDDSDAESGSELGAAVIL